MDNDLLQADILAALQKINAVLEITEENSASKNELATASYILCNVLTTLADEEAEE